MFAFLSSSSALQLGVFALAAVAVGFLVIGLRTVFARPDPLRSRIQRSLTMSPGVDTADLASGQDSSSLLEVALKPLAKIATPSDAEELAGIKEKLSHGGYRGERAVSAFLSAKVIAAITGASLVRLYASMQPEPMEQVTLYLLLAIALGFYAPNLWLSGRITERQAELNLSLPDAMDLLVTCVEAGLALEAALVRICSEIRLSSPLLAAELGQAALEVRTGSTRGEAFRRLADRTGLEELKYLSSVIVQAELFGTSVAKSLRVMAEGMRTRRIQRAERNAAAASVKMMIPLAFCVFPSLFVVLLAPAVINIMRNI